MTKTQEMNMVREQAYTDILDNLGGTRILDGIVVEINGYHVVLKPVVKKEQYDLESAVEEYEDHLLEVAEEQEKRARKQAEKEAKKAEKQAKKNTKTEATEEVANETETDTEVDAE